MHLLPRVLSVCSFFEPVLSSSSGSTVSLAYPFGTWEYTPARRQRACLSWCCASSLRVLPVLQVLQLSSIVSKQLPYPKKEVLFALILCSCFFSVYNTVAAKTKFFLVYLSHFLCPDLAFPRFALLLQLASLTLRLSFLFRWSLWKSKTKSDTYQFYNSFFFSEMKVAVFLNHAED